MARAELPQAIQDALYQLNRHCGLSRVGMPVIDGDGVLVEVDIPVALPSRSRAAGVSATGVRATETVFLRFGPQWPLKAPRVRLRADFPASLPHINPHRLGAQVPPCLFEGSLDELLHRFGLDEIIDQAIEWLRKAASNQLIDPNHGWEPTRRGDCSGTAAYDADQLAALVPTDGSVAAVLADYVVIGEGQYVAIKSNASVVSKPLFTQQPLSSTAAGGAKGALAVLLVGAPETNGTPQVFGDYKPDTVYDLATLYERAAELGISTDALRQSLDDHYLRSLRATGQIQWTWLNGFYCLVVLAVHRPVALVGSQRRSVELIPYIVRYRCLPKTTLQANAEVLGVVHAHSLTPELLARTSGFEHVDTAQPIVLLGCGSLGSKIGLHLGRAGFGAFTFVDNEHFSPHNSARHALVVDAERVIQPHKAQQLHEAFKSLGHVNATNLDKDVATMFVDRKLTEFDHVVRRDARLIIEATASLKVLAAATDSPGLDRHDGRLVRTLMYGQGRAAVLLLEGPKRECRVDDLTATLFERCRTNTALRASIIGDRLDPTQVFVGDNCSSLTTPMSDATVSRSASLIAMQVERWVTRQFPRDAMICFGTASDDGIGMTWESHAVAKTTVISVSDDGGWQVRVLQFAAAGIDADVQRWIPLETGGALLGHVCLATRTIVIAGLVDAPPDSVRERTRFVLGTRGLVGALGQANDDSVGHLQFVGTWHSHPNGGKHSSIDLRTLAAIAGDTRGLPAVSLVWTPGGLTCAITRR